jgi:hypothetical protein
LRGYSFAFLIVLAAVLTDVAPAGAWTAPVAISGPGEVEPSIPRIARGSGGKMLVAYRHKEPGWDILYRERSATGFWGPIEQVSSPWTERADVIEDPLGRPHMFFAGTGAGGKVDLFEAVRNGGTWTVTQFTNTADLDEDYPKLATDSLGRIHLVYSKASGGNGSVYYRVWQNGVWSGETYLGSNQSTYYHRPDISVDSNNNVHVVYCTATSIYYRKFDGASWSAQATIATTPNFFAYPKIAAATPNNIVMVTFDQETQAKLKYVASNNGGATWSPLTYLNDGHYPSLDAYGGYAHLVYQWAGGKPTGYRRWDGSNWTAPERCTPETNWQGWADVAADAAGVVHVVYDQSAVFYVNSSIDNIAPLPPTSFTAVASDGSAQLSWRNPSDPDFAGTVIRGKIGSYPTSPWDGNLICNRVTAPGATDTYTVTGLANGTTYYFSAFAYDGVPNYSSAAHVSATPHKTTCGELKLLADGAFATLTGEVVSAVFSSDGVIYVEEPDRSSGIRVVANTTGLAVGDRVNVTGTMGTRVVSGYVSERQVSSATVTKTSSGPALTPLAMGCSSVGGAAVGGVPGVKDGVGTNNMGLLVKIAGRVTKVLGTYVYIDDGSGVENASGSGPEVGVMVRCVSTPTFPTGSIVSATGIIEGSIPTGWTTNRRYIRARDASDVRVYSNAALGSIAGAVKDRQGAGIPGATVSTNTGGYSATTGSDGSYAISGVTPGSYTVTASKSGYQSQSTSVSVTAGQTATANFTLQANPTNVLANGNFEGGFFDFWGGQIANSWGASFRANGSGDNTEWVDYNWGAPHGHAQQVYVNQQGTGEAGISQRITGLTPGTTFTFSAYAYQTNTNSTCWIAVDPNGGTTLPARNTAFTNTAGQWNYQQVTGTVGAGGAVTVFLWVWHQTNPPGYCWFDDASLMAQ